MPVCVYLVSKARGLITGGEVHGFLDQALCRQ